MLDVAFNHRRRGDVQRLRSEIEAGRLGRPYYAKAWWLRRTGIPTLGSWFTRAELAGGGPLVDIGVHVLDYALFLLGNPGVRTVSASTYDLLGSNGFGGSKDSVKSGATDATFDVEDLATVFMRLDDGGTLLLEASWAAHRADGDQFGATLYGTEGGAEWIVDDYAEVGSLKVFGDDDGHRHRGAPARPSRAASTSRSCEEFVATVRSGDWQGHDGAAAAQLARIVDACYASAREQREVTLDPAAV